MEIFDYYLDAENISEKRGEVKRIQHMPSLSNNAETRGATHPNPALIYDGILNLHGEGVGLRYELSPRPVGRGALADRHGSISSFIALAASSAAFAGGLYQLSGMHLKPGRQFPDWSIY